MARAPALHAGGQGFDSLILHNWVYPTAPRGNITPYQGVWVEPAQRFFDILAKIEREISKIIFEKINKGRMVNALALRGEEGRDKLR